MKDPTRYHLIDNLRGIAIINMVIYHAIWNLVYIFNFEFDWFKSDIACVWEQFICWTFIFLSGFCFNFSKNKFQNGAKIFLLGIVVSLTTIVVTPESKIIFGVLTLIGSSMLIIYFLENYFNKINALFGCIMLFILFIITKNINTGFLGFGKLNLYELPKELYTNYYTAYLGFPHNNFSSSDYFSLVPWLFLFTAGYYFNIYLTENKLLKYLKGHKITTLSWISKKSIKIYLAHQPILYLIMYIFL